MLYNVVKLDVGERMRTFNDDYPKRGIVWYYYDVWSKKRKDGTSLWADVLKKIGDNAKKRRSAQG